MKKTKQYFYKNIKTHLHTYLPYSKHLHRTTKIIHTQKNLFFNNSKPTIEISRIWSTLRFFPARLRTARKRRIPAY